MIQWDTEVDATGDSSAVLSDSVATEDTVAAATEAKAKVRAAYTYKITLTNDKSSGKIYQIGIKQVKK